jgi:chromosome partitioning protein
MLILKGSQRLQKIVVLNSKGGSGKTTLALNLAGYLASTGRKTAIIDMDRQGSSMRWLHNRSSELPKIVGIPSEVSYTDASGNQCIVVPEDIDCAILDAPAGLPEHRLIDYTCGAHAIFVPVLPSDLDVHAASRLISSLLLKAQVSRRNQRLCVVPNRVKERTIAYQQLCRFLDRLSIDVVGVVRDSQNYVWAAKNGTCIHEMPQFRVSKDKEHWVAISAWLEKRLATPLNSRDLLRPQEAVRKRQRKRLRLVQPVSLVAALGLIAVTLGLLLPDARALVAQNPFQFLSPDSESDNHDDVAEATVRQTAGGTSDVLESRWRLNGTVNWGDSGLLIVRNRDTDASLVVRSSHELDGWRVTEIGTDFAVFSQGAEEARLDLGYE